MQRFSHAPLMVDISRFANLNPASIAFLSPAGCESIVLIDRRTIGTHAPWLVMAVVITASCFAGYMAELAISDPRRFPGGSSRAGFCIGIAAGLIFLFEF